MTSRNAIANALVDALSTLAATTRTYRYLNDINDFPSICLGGTPSVDYVHYGNGQRLQTMRQLLRGYVRTTEEDSLIDSETLAANIESIVNGFAESVPGVYDARVTQLSTDEGLLSPYGICDVLIEIRYEQTD